ncbi:MAG: transglycosylase domain-containing protein [Actinomycetota bacterium]
MSDARPTRPQGPPAVSGWAKLMMLIGILLAAGLLLGASLAPAASLTANVVGEVDEGLFDYPPLPEDLGEPWERSVILDRDGGELAVIREENRVVVDLADVPDHVQEAVLATEDREFLQHDGVDWSAIGRAAVDNATAGEITGGGSTITQQLVKLVVLDSDQTLDRKLQEAIYAIELEQRLSKGEILAAYLNEAYFGNRVYGIATAAEFYWGKDVSELDVTEGAVLAGMLRAPNRNDPLANPDRALARRNIVLAQMGRAGFLDESEVSRLQDTSLGLDVQPLAGPSEPFFINHVRNALLEDPALGADRDERERTLRRGGLEIRTTLDPDLQDLAQETITDLLDDDEDPLAAIATVEPGTGELLALGVGPKGFGSGEGEIEVNLAAREGGGSSRDAGSAFKPFMLAAALEEGLSPGHTYEGGVSYEFDNVACEAGYEPANFGQASHGAMDMARATTISSNVYFAHLLDVVGIEPLVDALEDAGIPISDRERLVEGPICSLVLGAGGQAAGVFPLEMATAYATFANEGERCEPYAVAEVTDRHGRTVSRAEGDCATAFDPGVANRVTDLLRGPIASGTASANGQIGRPAAGKTGTTQDSEDAWFVGYVPQLSTAVWTGYEQPETMTHGLCGGQVTGGCLPTILWRDYMRAAVDALDLEVADFPAPPPVPTTTVPSVVGQPAETAEDILADADFRPSATAVEHWAEAGTVIDQSPAGGSSAEEGSLVELEVSDGSRDPPVVPDLVGLGVEEATDVLDEAGLAYDRRDVPVDDDEAYDTVVAQTPAAREPAYDGTTAVTVTIDVGRPRTAEDPEPETGTAGSAGSAEDDS